MKRFAILIGLFVVTTSAFPWDQSRNSLLLPAEPSTLFKLDEAQQRLDRADIRRQMDYEARRAAAEEAQEIARLEAEERAERARQEAEDRAAAIENRERIASAGSRTLLYEAFAFLVLAVAANKIIRDKRRSEDNALKPQEKAGVFIGIVGGAIILSALFVSGPWIPQLDFWQNLMNEFFTIEFWPDVPTKFVVLPCIGLILYGALVYLEILKAPQKLLSRFE